MAGEQPRWRQVFDSAESRVSPRVDGFVRSEAVQIAMGLAARARRSAQQQAERTMRRALHTVNLPAGSDVTRILNELGRLQREVRALARRLDELQRKEVTSGATRSRAAGRTGSSRR